MELGVEIEDGLWVGRDGMWEESARASINKVHGPGCPC